MKHAVFVLLGFMVLVGCSSTFPRSEIPRWSIALSISEEDLTTIVRTVEERYRQRIVNLSRSQDGTIMVLITNRPKPVHGTALIFREINGRWEEDAKRRGEWIQ